MSNILRSINGIRADPSVRVDAPDSSSTYHLQRDCIAAHVTAVRGRHRCDDRGSPFVAACRMRGPGDARRAARARRRRDAARLDRRCLIMDLPITRADAARSRAGTACAFPRRNRHAGVCRAASAVALGKGNGRAFRALAAQGRRRRHAARIPKATLAELKNAALLPRRGDTS